jgi:DNA-binding NtrC family response regulator
MDEKQRVRVPQLVRYFVQKFSRRLNKDVAYIPADATDALANHSWPGNIRELENFIERAVLLSSGKELHVPVSELKPASLTPASDTDSSSTSLASLLPLLPRFPPSETLSDGIFSARFAKRNGVSLAPRAPRFSSA